MSQNSEKRGKLVIISAPSGAGKTTIIKRLLERNEGLTRSISYTTRKPRQGEENGRDYFFVSQGEFDSKKDENFFLESATVFDCSYGTSRDFVKEQIDKGCDVILAIDVQGMKQVKRAAAKEINIVSIFVLPPSGEELQKRLEDRQTESRTEIDKRMQVATKEISESSLYDYQVVNDEIDQAVQKIEEMI
jgi:guanylate kinase